MDEEEIPDDMKEKAEEYHPRVRLFHPSSSSSSFITIKPSSPIVMPFLHYIITLTPLFRMIHLARIRTLHHQHVMKEEEEAFFANIHPIRSSPPS